MECLFLALHLRRGGAGLGCRSIGIRVPASSRDCVTHGSPVNVLPEAHFLPALPRAALEAAALGHAAALLRLRGRLALQTRRAGLVREVGVGGFLRSLVYMGGRM
jgi:hypothetical protein